MSSRYLLPLQALPFFDTTTLKSLYPDLPASHLRTYLSYWVKTGAIHRLANGLFVTHDAYLQYFSHPAYREYIAVKLSYPSYLSTEYVLSKNNLLSEGVFAITSVTLKEKKDRQNILGNYIFRQISPTLFTGFVRKNFLAYEYYEATPAKALFDYLYYRLNTLTLERITVTLFTEDLRINLEALEATDISEFAKYVELAGSKKFQSIYEILRKEYSHAPNFDAAQTKG